jgi:hypothetical protein
MGSGAHLYRFCEAGRKKVLLEREKLWLEQRRVEVLTELQAVEENVKELMLKPEAVKVVLDFAPGIAKMFGIVQVQRDGDELSCDDNNKDPELLTEDDKESKLAAKKDKASDPRPSIASLGDGQTV